MDAAPVVVRFLGGRKAASEDGTPISRTVAPALDASRGAGLSRRGIDERVCGDENRGAQGEQHHGYR